MRTLVISQLESPEIHRMAAVQMALRNISGDIIPGLSVVDGLVENRAEIRLFDATTEDVRTLWSDLRDGLGLTCAWYDGPEGEGCILEALPPKRKPFPLDGHRVPRIIPQRSTSKASVAAYPSPDSIHPLNR